MARRMVLIAAAAIAALCLASPAWGTEPPCKLTPRVKCFGVESVEASLSTAQAGGHPDLTFTVEVKKDPESATNAFGFKNSYAATRNIRFELPPGLIGDPNVLGAPQQCTTAELFSWEEANGGCPNGSQVGISTVTTYENGRWQEPVYMMAPPGGDVVARLGLVAVLYPTFIDLKVRSESDYGITAEVVNAPSIASLTQLETTTWGVPAASSHDTERCTPREAFHFGCVVSPPRPPGSRELPFLTNPTRCGVPLEMRVSASSWAEPERFDAKSASFPEISGCNQLPFGPGLTVEPTSRRAGAPTGAEITVSLPAASGVEVLEPSQMREIAITFPQGLVLNPGAADGLVACSVQQVRIGERVAAECPDASKLAETEFDIPVLERKLKGAIYLREPELESESPFRIWIVADDLGLHIKLPGQLDVDEETGQIESIVLDPEAEAEGLMETEGIPQAPVREATIALKSGPRAALVNPPACGEYLSEYDFVPWSGGPDAIGSSPVTVDEGCTGLGGFDPRLSAGATVPGAGEHAPFLFTLTREDGDQNLASFDVSLPQGLSATFAGIERCEGSAAETGACPAGSRIGRVVAAVGAGPDPLWVPQEGFGKRPTAVYLSGPYRGAPLSIVAVVPRQAGPFDFGDEVVRSAIYVDPNTAMATAKTDPLPQIIEGIPISYRTLHVELDRPGFTLNPTNCALKRTEATVISTQGAVAHPYSTFAAVNCASLGFQPRLAIRLTGGTHRGAHPRLTAVLKMPPGDANVGGARVALPSSEFVDNEHFNNVCTRVQFAAHECPPGSIYGSAVARTPLFDFPLEGSVYLRSAPERELPDVVAALRGPASMPIEVDLDGHVDSVHGGLRTTFESVPDAPVTEFILQMAGGKKGLIVNSTNLCSAIHKATAKFTGQNGKRAVLHPVMKASCRKHRRQKSAH